MSDREQSPEGESEKVAQLYLASIVEFAEEAIISKTLDGIVTGWNHAAERVFGYTAEEMIGKPVAILIPPEHHNEEPEILARLRRGEFVKIYDTQRVRKDGRLIDVSLTVSPIRDHTGKIIGASKIARDITEHKQADLRQQQALEEARKARHDAEVANRLKDEFLAAVSHELRTPLTAVLGWVRMIRGGGLDDATIERALEVIDRNIRSQAQLIEDLLDISRITMGKLRLDVRPVQPSTIITAVVESLQVAADARRLRIQTVLDSHAGPVSGDSERLQQVLWNILSNAIKFTPKGGRIQIVLERVNSHIEIRVTDTGRGIKPEFLPYIFERFTQAESVTTRAHGGLGVGLAISKAIVELHGGNIAAKSEGEGQGSTFIVNLPLMPVTRQVRDDETRVHPKAWTEISLECPPAVKGLKILVIDDDEDTADMIRAVLTRCGGIVETASNAEGGLEVLKNQTPDVLLCDIGMPDVDGYEFIRRVRAAERETKKKVPAVALTAFARIEDRVKALAAGFQMHVAKPVEPGELLTIVASLSGFLDQQH